MERSLARRRSPCLVVGLLAIAPLTMAANGQGCGQSGFLSKTDAPDATGVWNVSYDDKLTVEVTIGGATYTKELGAQGGAFTITHDGQPFEFDLDCAKPEIICPSEAWADHVTIDQHDETHPHHVFVNIPKNVCDGQLVAAEPASCGQGTENPDCEKVCTGELVTEEQETFGLINEAGDHFDLLLGAGAATNGINCGLLAVSIADSELTTSGSKETNDWKVESFDDGEVIVAYSGGCIWLGDPNMDGQTEALALGATVKFTTGFTAKR